MQLGRRLDCSQVKQTVDTAGSACYVFGFSKRMLRSEDIVKVRSKALS